jgi:2-octaprenyl-6-methoxyphenol hydroxylase
MVDVDVAADPTESFKLGARLLVVADGAHSPVRGLLGIGAEQRRYAQHAIVGNLRTERPIGDTAYERFTAQGPLALLPMVGNRAAFVWTVPEHDAPHVAGLGDDAFLAELQAAFGTRLGSFEHAGVRSSYPLFLSKALRITAPRSALVGNAAHGLHPVAAQGFNLGLRDVAALVDCIADALGGPDGAHSIGDAAVLDRYAAWRRADQMKLVSFTDGLARLFTTARAPLRTLRDVGMLAFDLVPGVRREFARHTMGLAGRLPRLSRGVVPR